MKKIINHRINNCYNCGKSIKPYKSEQYGYIHIINNEEKVFCIKCHLDVRYKK